MTPYYQDDAVTIYHGDTSEVDLAALGGGVVVADPPYGIKWQTAGLGRKRGATFDWRPIYGDDQPFDPTQILALGLPTVLFGGNHFADRLPTSPSWLVWDKRGRNGFSNDQSDCELAWSNLGGPARMFRFVWNGGAGDLANRVGRHRAHPTQKPVQVMHWAIGLCPSGVVLDPYMGSGSTLVAAKALGRHAIGIEIDEAYCEMAANRCRQEVLGLSA